MYRPWRNIHDKHGNSLFYKLSVATLHTVTGVTVHWHEIFESSNISFFPTRIQQYFWCSSDECYHHFAFKNPHFTHFHSRNVLALARNREEAILNTIKLKKKYNTT